MLECVRALYGDPEFARYLVFTPEQHFADEACTDRLYHDMYTGKWWWAMQVSHDSSFSAAANVASQDVLEEKNPGATIIPIIISSDKTQLTAFGNKSAYPVYLTIGNLPKDIRRKPSRQGQILLAYLPTTHLDHVTNQASRRRLVLNIMHKCLRTVVAPLKTVGEAGMPIASGDAVWRRGHPIYAAHIGDYMKQIAVAGIKLGECAQCTVPRDELGELDEYPLRSLEAILAALAKFDSDPDTFIQACREAGVKPIIHPFWEGLPYADICLSITPDILHQLLQGLIKHLVTWIKSAYGTEELDARCRALPQNSSVRHFFNSISPLSRITGKEHNDVARILLGLIIDLPLSGHLSNARLLHATRGMLDFLYLSQYPVHSTITLH